MKFFCLQLNFRKSYRRGHKFSNRSNEKEYYAFVSKVQGILRPQCQNGNKNYRFILQPKTDSQGSKIPFRDYSG